MTFEIRPDAVAFDNAVEEYERVRPSYPDQLFDDLWARLPSASPLIVEVGPGTGKATTSLLERGSTVVGVEPGPRMADFVRAKFARTHPEKFSVLNAPFELAELESSSFDVLFAATSFHWVDPGVRLTKARDVLKPRGAIAIVSTNQIRSAADGGFFDRVQPVYRKYYPDGETPTLPGEDVVPDEHTDLDACPMFDSVELLRYRWDQRYTTRDWADLVASFSNTQMMVPSARRGLIRDLSAVIDAEYGGEIVRPLVITLTFGLRS